MNDLPRHTLSRIIAEHGRGICDAPKRVEALLRDLCGSHRREINIITGALEERVAADLMTTGDSMPRDVLLARLEARLRDNLAYTPEAATWAVETWALALGTLSETELQARTRKKSAETGQSSALPSPQRGTTYAPQRQPSPLPKASPPPPIARPPAPIPRRTPPISPNSVVPGPPPQNVSPSLPSRQRPRRGLSLRGCFITFVLAILLIAVYYGVPAVLMILQEEQAQPSINDPRIK
jgi:hypothetical protein